MINLENKNEQLRKRVTRKLNFRQPSPPPNIYFIRRDPEYLNHYLNDPVSLEQAMTDSPKEYQLGFKLFQPQPEEEDIIRKIRHPQKRNFLHPEDPYYTKYKDKF